MTYEELVTIKVGIRPDDLERIKKNEVETVIIFYYSYSKRFIITEVPEGVCSKE